MYNLHPNQSVEDRRDNDRSSLSATKSDILIDIREISDRGYVSSNMF